MNGEPSSIDIALEKHWSALDLFNRMKLLIDLKIDGTDKKFLEGRTMDEILKSGQDDLPGEIRGRLILALTNEGFSKGEYERCVAAMRGPERK